MGSCLSKKSVCSSSSPPPPALPDPPGKLKSETQPEKKKETAVKKELFIIKHRTSHELDRRRSEEEEEKVEIGENASSSGIQCGRLSRSSSTGKAVLSSGRRFSGSKKSYDFDSEKRRHDDDFNADGDDEATEKENRRRTPSRERGGGSRRVSRSPGRRSESPISAVSNGSCRAGKMISVPASVSNAEAGVKRIQVIRNVGSPRAMSPARSRAANNSNQHPISLSRSNSRKAGVSPCKRNPLTHITTQKLNAADNVTNNNCSKQGHHRVRSNENLKMTRIRSSRQSRDLDVDPEAPSTPSTCSYTALLLQDIHNFHQKSTTPPPFSPLPLCVTKARSILEAVANLNSTTDFPNHITVRRGADDLESSGSNSFARRSRSISRQNENGKKRDGDSGIGVLHRAPASAVAFGMKLDAA